MNQSVDQPFFLGIGAHKSGTTWLYENLKRHPNVWLPPVKELHFFDGLPNLPKVGHRLNELLKEVLATGQITDAARLDFLRRYVLEQPKDAGWYRSLFEGAGDRRGGDITPAYAILPDPVVGRIKALLPNSRIIFIMRNPIERAWSHFRYNAGNHEFDLSKHGFEEFRRHVDSPSSESRTVYTRTIAIWERHYSKDQMLCLFHDDLRVDPAGLLARVCEFLGISFDAAFFSGTRDAVIRKSMDLEMPRELRRYLARKYCAEIAALEQRFGGHAARWRADCEQVLSGPG